jgi:Peptidase family S58
VESRLPSQQGSNESEDFAVAFSTAESVGVKRGTEPATYTILRSEQVSPLLEMALEPAEEAVYNSLLQATTVECKFGRVEAIPIGGGRIKWNRRSLEQECWGSNRCAHGSESRSEYETCTVRDE